MNFRLDGKAFFFTYPKCTLTRERCLELLQPKFAGNNILNYCIAQEKHADGSDHLHCLIVVERRKNTTNPAYFDIEGFHGNYQVCRKRLQVYDYITKADATPLSNFDMAALKCKTNGQRQEIAKKLLAGERPQDLVEEYPTMIFGFKRLQDDIRALEETKVEYRAPPTFLRNDWGFLIQPYSNKKKRHFWIYSTAPNRGKTTWARYLATEYGAYIKSSEFAYWNVTGRESFIILDDYNTAGLRFNALNQLCDGSYEARVFMGGVRRLQPKLVIVLSNVTIRDLYPNMYALLEARFNIKCID